MQRTARGSCVAARRSRYPLWRTTKSSEAVTSCEEELYAMNKGVSEAMVINGVAADVRIDVDLVLMTDASAALEAGAASVRRGAQTRKK